MFAVAAAVIVLLGGLVLLGVVLGVVPGREALQGVLNQPKPAFSVHFINVGQGDCELILDHGKVMLIDAGEADEAYTVISYLRRQKVETIDYLVATHPHSDHIGALPAVIRAFAVKNVILPRLSQENTPTTYYYEQLLTAVKDSGARVIAAKPGAAYALGEGRFTVLAPMKQDEELNNMSVVLRLTYLEKGFLFTGDAEAPVEEQLLASHADVSCDVLKLGHHGSSTSNTEPFLTAAAPQYAVAECGYQNSYGHPHRETVALCRALGIELLRTDKHGDVVFLVADDGAITVKKEKNG